MKPVAAEDDAGRDGPFSALGRAVWDETVMAKLTK